MVKRRWSERLITLYLLIVTVSIVGHFVTDAVCVTLNAAGGYECAAGNVTDGRPDSPSPVTADLHGSFDIPPIFSAISLIVPTFILITITLASSPYSPSPSPPPPKPLS